MKMLKKSLLPFAVCATFATLSLSFGRAERTGNLSPMPAAPATAATMNTQPVQSPLHNLYDSLQLEGKGLSRQAFDYAVAGYQKLVRNGSLHNTDYLTIVDLSQSSRKKRFYLIDVRNARLVENTYVAHGRNSGLDEAASFSNLPESNQSSLGFYITKGTYTGKHGMSLKLSGLEKGFNDNAEARAIVVHGADYVNEGRVASAFMGRSLGCPALANDVAPRVINTIKDGSALFVYYPSDNYIHSSALLQA